MESNIEPPAYTKEQIGSYRTINKSSALQKSTNLGERALSCPVLSAPSMKLSRPKFVHHLDHCAEEAQRESKNIVFAPKAILI